MKVLIIASFLMFSAPGDQIASQESDCAYAQKIDGLIGALEQKVDRNDALLYYLTLRSTFEDVAGLVNNVALIFLLQEKNDLLEKKIADLYLKRMLHNIKKHAPDPNYA